MWPNITPPPVSAVHRLTPKNGSETTGETHKSHTKKIWTMHAYVK